MKYSGYFLIIICLSALFPSCDGFFGTETETDFLDVPIQDAREVAYVPILPVISDLSEPVDIIAGYDELMYVVDGSTEEVISFDQAGSELGRIGVPGVTAIAQDRQLNILALGRIDTVINEAAVNLAAIYRLNLSVNSQYSIEQAQIEVVAIHPFYFRTGTPTAEDQQVSFTGIATLANNQYYVARNGPSNIPNKFGGPDDTILLFSEKDSFLTPIFVNTSFGLVRDFFRNPQGISTFAIPPQSPAVNPAGDIIVTSIAPSSALQVQLIRNVQPLDAPDFYELQILPNGDTSRADGFLYTPNRFSQALDVTITGDGTNYIFVVDAEQDSLYQFSLQGFEGVIPPPGSESNRAINVSFGGRGEGLTQFRQPSGVAYLNQILYVADTGNGRILRFKLTTDFD